MEQPKPKPMIGLFEALYTSRALRRLTPDSIPDEGWGEGWIRPSARK